MGSATLRACQGPGCHANHRAVMNRVALPAQAKSMTVSFWRGCPMIDHISIAVSDLKRSAKFYDQVLEPLGLKRLVEREKSIGFGKTYPEFWLNARPGMAPVETETGNHVCLRARSKQAVAAFYETAIALGGCGDGEPRNRQAAMTVYFGAFIRDFDGNKIEALTVPE
jgi:catechol 2,3-dioxygenase-like lactoylglutathione lyase family enzyme